MGDRDISEMTAQPNKREVMDESKFSLDELIDFLCGIKRLDGLWYGEPQLGRPTFWWRDHLRSAAAAAEARGAEKVLACVGEDEEVEKGYNHGTRLVDTKAAIRNSLRAEIRAALAAQQKGQDGGE